MRHSLCVLSFRPVVLVIALLAGCDAAPPGGAAIPTTPASNPESASGVAVGTGASESSPPARPSACALVTVAEMTAITGGALVARPDETHGGKTICNYEPPEPVPYSVPYVELSVDWGSGEGAMQAMGMLNGSEPGLVDNEEGLGDQSMRAGSAVMIRHGEDLVTIVVSGVDDEPAAVRKIFETASTKL